jgi:hypothetical protein
MRKNWRWYNFICAKLNYVILVSVDRIIVSNFQNRMAAKLFCRSIFLSSFRSVVLSFCRSVVLSFCRSVVLSFCRSAVLSFCRSVVLFFCRSVDLSFFVLSYCRSVVLSFCPSVVLSFCHSVVLSFCCSVVLSFYRSVQSRHSILVNNCTLCYTESLWPRRLLIQYQLPPLLCYVVDDKISSHELFLRSVDRFP